MKWFLIGDEKKMLKATIQTNFIYQIREKEVAIVQASVQQSEKYYNDNRAVSNRSRSESKYFSIGLVLGRLKLVLTGNQSGERTP